MKNNDILERKTLGGGGLTKQDVGLNLYSCIYTSCLNECLHSQCGMKRNMV